MFSILDAKNPLAAFAQTKPKISETTKKAVSESAAFLTSLAEEKGGKGKTTKTPPKSTTESTESPSKFGIESAPKSTTSTTTTTSTSPTITTEEPPYSPLFSSAPSSPILNTQPFPEFDDLELDQLSPLFAPDSPGFSPSSPLREKESAKENKEESEEKDENIRMLEDALSETKKLLDEVRIALFFLLFSFCPFFLYLFPNNNCNLDSFSFLFSFFPLSSSPLSR